MKNSSTDSRPDSGVSISVSDSIFDKFFDAMRDDVDLAEIEPTLRRLVLEDGVFAEPAIRAALFPDAP